MQSEKTMTEPAGLEVLRNQIEAWRSTRPRTRPMPEVLWNEAASLARESGVNRIARELGLSFTALKRRTGSTVTNRRSQREAANAPVLPTRTDFVEVKGLAEVSRTGVSHETIVEVVACDGARLSIRLKCASADVAALIHAFRGHA